MYSFVSGMIAGALTTLIVGGYVLVHYHDKQRRNESYEP